VMLPEGKAVPVMLGLELLSSTLSQPMTPPAVTLTMSDTL